MPFLIAYLMVGQLVDGLLAPGQPVLDVMPGILFKTDGARRLAPYAVLKSLSARLSGAEDEKLQPALMTVSPDVRILVAIVEELEDGNLTVFVPIAPTPGIGFLQIVSPARIERLECPMSDALGWALNWGAETGVLFKGRSS